MPLQNRVTPFGEIVAAPWRGEVMGNRGVLHDGARRLGRARWRHKAWICCRLAFRGRHRVPMTPGRWTELFFLDEVSALAAGHRPCHECRRADALAFRAAWEAAGLPGRRAAEIDAVLHAARIGPDRRQRTHEAALADLPDGAFVMREGAALLLWRGRFWRWSGDGYADAGPQGPAGAGSVRVLTPAPVVAVLRAGYRPATRAGTGPLSPDCGR